MSNDLTNDSPYEVDRAIVVLKEQRKKIDDKIKELRKAKVIADKINCDVSSEYPAEKNNLK